jgi:hypothetical protein
MGSLYTAAVASQGSIRSVSVSLGPEGAVAYCTNDTSVLPEAGWQLTQLDLAMPFSQDDMGNVVFTLTWV